MHWNRYWWVSVLHWLAEKTGRAHNMLVQTLEGEIVLIRPVDLKRFPGAKVIKDIKDV